MKGNFILLLLVLCPFVGGILSFVAGKISHRLRDYTADAVTLLELAATVNCHKFLGTSLSIKGICGLGINFTLDGFRLIYAVIIAYMWAATTIFSREYMAHHHNRNRYYLYVLMTLGAIMGVFLSADLFTTFIFFEVMSLVSCVMVVQDETKAAISAAQTYLAIAIIGGLATLTGLILLNALTGTLNIAALPEAAAVVTDRAKLYTAGFLVFIGFASKAAIFPAHVWLPTAHTAAPAPSSALLSGLLTKSGLFGVLVLSAGPFLHDPKWGMMLLIPALITMVLGAVLAVFSVNIKRTLACSSMSQLGFILTGVAMQCFLGPDNDLAVRGTVLYMIGHSLIKLVLFLAAGVIHMNTHKLNLNEIRGFGRGKPVFCFVFLMGALGLIGMPLWNGYIGKTLIHESIVEYVHHLGGSEEFYLRTFGFQCVEWAFLISGALTTAYMTKLFAMLFIAKPAQDLEQKTGPYMNAVNTLILLASALALPVIGCMPYKLADKLGFLGAGFMNGPAVHHALDYFSFEALEGAAISLGLGALIYIFFVRSVLMRRGANGEVLCNDLWPGWLDLEHLVFRPVLMGVLPFAGALFARTVDLVCAGPVSLVLSHASRQRFVRLPEDTDFGFYHDEDRAPSLRTVLPSSLAYSLMTFVFGLLFVLGYLVL